MFAGDVTFSQCDVVHRRKRLCLCKRMRTQKRKKVALEGLRKILIDGSDRVVQISAMLPEEQATTLKLLLMNSRNSLPGSPVTCRLLARASSLTR